MNDLLSRRAIFKGFCAAAPAMLATDRLWAQAGQGKARGLLAGGDQRIAARIFADGGNAFDAAVSAALAACVSAPFQVGIGGYGGHATLFSAKTRRIAAIDFNTIAPAEAHARMFQPRPGDKGRPDHEYGWLAASIPGVLAGLQFILDNHGTRRLPEMLQPAIALARDGVRVEGALATAIASSAKHFAADAASRKLYFQEDRPLRAGERLGNPELADLLTTLAKRGNVDSFYRGDIARSIADWFRKNGGLVTAKDLARFAVREERPLELTWNDLTIHTVPLTAGGMTFIQALRTLQAMRWQRLPAGLAQTHARIEAMRFAWRDRLTLLGDPQTVKAPVERLLSEAYAKECAARIEVAVRKGQILAQNVTPRDHVGTINVSAADENGNFIAMTLTHGLVFGARVTVPGLGLTLGGGMSRFDSDPAHPNAPGPNKRPLTNMCPTVVTRKGIPILAVGGAGGRRIQNSMYETLIQFVVHGRPLAGSLASPRFHTEGNANLYLEKTWPEKEAAELGKLGYRMLQGQGAALTAVALEKETLTRGIR